VTDTPHASTDKGDANSQRPKPPGTARVPITDSDDLKLQTTLEDEQYLARMLDLRAQVEARSKKPLNFDSEILVEAEMITQRFTADLLKLAVRRARTRPNDTVLLMEDLAWSRQLLVNGSGGGLLVLFLTTIGGLVMGVGAPMIVTPVVTETIDKMTSATLAVGGGGVAVGTALLTAGFVLAARRK